jgi:hypothetical protein
MAKEIKIKWLAEPEAKVYQAATSYLNLLYEDSTLKTLVKKLKKAHFRIQCQRCY